MTEALKILAGAALLGYAWWRRRRRTDIDIRGDRFWTWHRYAGSAVLALFGLLLIGSGVAGIV